VRRSTKVIVGNVAILGLFATVGVMAACGNSNQQSAATVKCEVPDNCINLRNAKIIQEPDGFRNVSFGCWDTSGVYVTSRGVYQVGGENAPALPSTVVIVVDDPHCKS